MVDLFTTPPDNEGIMATNAKDQTDSTQTKAADTSVASSKAQAAESAAGQTQVFFVPEYNVSVEAESLDAAVEKAKELKGVK